LQLYSGKIVFGFFQKQFCDVYKLSLPKLSGFKFTTKKYGNYSILPSQNCFGLAINLLLLKKAFGISSLI